ncbi:hypothetical protein [Halomonas rhizosphaerae]|uniref:Uncharacterized protein n=1 Tax=Halomonas rhizosphaerae TaxID=3043296 RepID=A0ABT6V3T0_9GAMM|nr:hypothetical protein [Halomonas rhizosphaerae]MDI5891592.1 hypothetical protein [Halomonas rhizosphaerae]
MFDAWFSDVKEENKKALMSVGGGLAFGASVATIGMIINRTPKNVIPCSSIEALFSPDLILFTTTGACIIQLLFIFTSGNNKAARFFHLKASELTSSFLGGIIALSFFLYMDEFGLTYHPLLKTAPLIISTLIILFGILTYFPMLSSLFFDINKRNYKDGINFYIVTWLAVFSLVGLSAIIFSNEPIATLEICAK